MLFPSTPDVPTIPLHVLVWMLTNLGGMGTPWMLFFTNSVSLASWALVLSGILSQVCSDVSRKSD